ncbi:30S ribosomal protein S6e [Candidatus Bathyarchaeota archaeon]|nr:MAG: 30S ribosomal protein S6e [Candidatus Bathyarchaeota archaeon]
MAKFKLIISDPSTGRSKVVEVEGPKAVPLLGKRIGEVVDGAFADLPGVKLQVTGGTDKDGFPMRWDVHGGVKTRVILSGPPGFHPKRKGERRRKTVRGDTITEDIVQVNMKVVEGKLLLEEEKKGEESESEQAQK